jgi:MFS family permease
MGRISDKIGRQTPMVLGSAISCLLLLAFPFATQFPLLLLLSIGYGLGFAMVISSTSALISELAPVNLVGTSMGFLSTTMDVGQTLGPIISGLILATSLQYVGIFSSFSLLLVIAGSVFIASGIMKQHGPQRK